MTHFTRSSSSSSKSFEFIDVNRPRLFAKLIRPKFGKKDDEMKIRIYTYEYLHECEGKLEGERVEKTVRVQCTYVIRILVLPMLISIEQLTRKTVYGHLEFSTLFSVSPGPARALTRSLVSITGARSLSYFRIHRNNQKRAIFDPKSRF